MLFPKNRSHVLAFALLGLFLLGWYKHASSLLAVTGAMTALASKQGPTAAMHPDNASPALTIGGQQVIQLKRKSQHTAQKPEFLTATILPGRGMNLFQVTAFLPGKGEIEVFASPSLQDAAQILNSEEPEEHGVKSFTFGGAFIAPYPNRVRGNLSPDRKTITTNWNGKALTLPAVWKGKKNPNAELHAIHGLILDHKTDDVAVTTTPGGQTVTGTIHAGDFGGYWLSKTDLTVRIALTVKTVDATITAKNVGTEPEPMGIGWHPYFAIPSGDRKQARLHIPASQMAEVNNYDDVFPTGKLVNLKGTRYDFSSPGGKPLDDIFLDDNFSHLSHTGGQVLVDLLDPAARYGIHIRGLSPEIKTVQVYAPPDKAFAAIEEQFNFADPFSRIWKGMDTGMITLAPGKSVRWKVRLELFVL
jgi:aldose 1-epimerase